MCEAPFKMERGCLLEKRCPACRLLGIQNNPGNPYFLKRWSVFVKREASTYKNWCFYDQTEPLKMLYSMLAPAEEVPDIMDTIILNDNREHIMDILYSNFNKREVYIVMQEARECTQGEIAKDLGITRERVRQILYSVYKRLRHPKIGKPLKKFNES